MPLAQIGLGFLEFLERRLGRPQGFIKTLFRHSSRLECPNCLLESARAEQFCPKTSVARHPSRLECRSCLLESARADQFPQNPVSFQKIRHSSRLECRTCLLESARAEQFAQNPLLFQKIRHSSRLECRSCLLEPARAEQFAKDCPKYLFFVFFNPLNSFLIKLSL